MEPIEMHGVEVKKVVWTGEKRDADGLQTQPPKVQLTLEIESPESALVKRLLDFAQRGPCSWSISSLQAEMSGMR